MALSLGRRHRSTRPAKIKVKIVFCRLKWHGRVASNFRAPTIQGRANPKFDLGV
jgi:hypothetical protein